jgi:hypothetical protein
LTQFVNPVVELVGVTLMTWLNNPPLAPPPAAAAVTRPLASTVIFALE